MSDAKDTTPSSGAQHGAVNWLKNYWALFVFLLVAIDSYWVLWGNVVAEIVAVFLMCVIGLDILVFKRSALNTIKKYWPAIALVIIISLSIYVRNFGYFTPDGGTRWPYLRNIDSYFFLRHTSDTIDNGNVVPDYDPLKTAPYGGERLPEHFYLYLSAYAFSAVSGFGFSLPYFMAMFPAILASLVAIPMYFIAKWLFDKKAGILASIFMVFAIPFMSRSLGGDPDSDAIVMLLAITSIAAFLMLYKKMEIGKIFSVKNVLLAAYFGAVLALFAYTWGGYWFTVWIVGGFIVLKIIADFLLHRKHVEGHIRIVWKHTKGLIALLVLAVAVFELMIIPVFGFQAATTFLTAPFGAIFGGEYKGEVGQFPNVGVSIAEVQAGGDARTVAVQASGLDIATSVSGLPIALLTLVSPFLLTLACFVYLAYSYYKRHEHLDTLIFTGVWFFGFLFASTIAVRFTIFLAPVYAICSSITLAKLWRISTGEDRKIGA